jgi:hypothetical protein
MSKIKDAGYTRVRGIYGKRGYLNVVEVQKHNLTQFSSRTLYMNIN